VRLDLVRVDLLVRLVDKLRLKELVEVRGHHPEEGGVVHLDGEPKTLEGEGSAKAWEVVHVVVNLGKDLLEHIVRENLLDDQAKRENQLVLLVAELKRVVELVGLGFVDVAAGLDDLVPVGGDGGANDGANEVGHRYVRCDWIEL
jgi:hypothetical protein